jgi:hypothetical protein
MPHLLAPYQYHFTSAPYTFFSLLPPTICSLINGQCSKIKYNAGSSECRCALGCNVSWPPTHA